MTAATVMRGYGPLMTQGTIFPQDQHQLQHFKWKAPSAGAQWMDLKQEAEPDFFASLDLAMLKAEQQQLQQQQQQQQQQHQQQQQQQQLSSSGSAAEPKSVLDLPRSSPGGGSPSHSYISTLTSKDQQQQQQKQQSPGAGGDVIIPPKMEERVQQQQQTDDLSTLLCGMAELLPPGLGLGGLDPMASFPPIVDRLDFDAFDVVEQFGSRDEDMLADILDVDDFSPSGKFGEPQLLRRSSTFPEYHPQQHQQQQQRPASPPGMGAYAAPYEEFPNFFRLLDSHFTDTHAFPQASNGHIHPELAAAVLRQVIPNEEELVPVQPVQERLVAPPDISGNFMQGQPMYEENLGLRLVHRLLSCAEAIHLEDPVYGSSILPRLLDDADPYGDPMQRIAVYFGEALRECLETKFPPNFVRNRQLQQQKQQQQQGVVQQVVVQQQQQQQQQQLLQQQQQQQQLLQQQQQQQQQQLLQQQQQQQQHNIIHDQNMPGSSLDHDLAYQAMYQVLPFIKFSQFTANQAILDAVGKRDRIHIIDLDIKQGLQWPGLIQSLAVRQGGPPSLKLTGVGLDALVLAQTGRRLDEFAASLHVPFRFEAVVAKVDNLHSLLFNLEGEEGLAVNCPAVMHRLLADEQALDKVLRMVKSLQPSVVTLLEVEGNHNSDSFFDRFVAALHYYSAMFDSLEATLERDSTERLRIESLCLANEIRNILACDAGDRTSRHVRMDVWRGFLHRAAFTPRGLSNHALYQAKLLLGLYSSSSYKFTHDGYCAILGWHDTPVVSVSAWCYYSQDSERSAM